MSSTQYRAIELAIIPRAGKVPGLELLAAATLGAQCPVKSVERRMRADHIANLIADSLLDVGL